MPEVRDGAYVVPRLKLCKDCKHIVYTQVTGSDEARAMCNRPYPEPSLSLVTGEFVDRRPTDAFRERQDPTFGESGKTCGLSARFYEPSVPPASMATVKTKAA